ncbi:PP2C family protein-serine/threonine phosphatase [Thalassoroseus pseudoceratinae]|uniref:PP2C family protein-serine/threonine phosphatase n=1 Tax=Thalassoroseus pseudoceratinae TaxID=2713176 RepID=UPI0014228FAF|nr:protein phosphatase 2C domain-containing protein [Thalassoroseus pseudoceratinae]
MIEIRSGFVSITGNFRDNNEDRGFVDPEGRYFLVADGMGGQSAGEKASELATELISEKFEQLIDFQSGESEEVCRAIDEAVAYANDEIMALGKVEPAFHNMGTTITLVVRVGQRLFAAGVGDSRIYLFRDGKLEQLTEDHSLTEALRRAGTITAEDAKTHRYRNVLYRYLGTKEGSNGTEAKELEPKPGDRFLMCSDGVTDGVPDSQLVEILTQNPDPQTAAQTAVESAQEGGSKDNITCLILDVV